MINDKFQFWFPLGTIEKAVDNIDPTADNALVLGGIASTIDSDSDGESLDPNGFDITPLMTSGVVNWHHQAKGQPKTIIGEPIKGEIRSEGLYLETMLYPSSQIARDVYELAQTLEADSQTRRLGYSIEGKVVKRKSNDKKHPDYKKILKAIITGVAVTHMPKNPKTFANIIKGEIDDDFDVEEAMDTENAGSTMPESVDGKKPKNLSKSEVLDDIFANITGITIEKAEKIYQLSLKIANMSKRKTVNDEDISKAYDALGLEIEKSDGGSPDSDAVEKADANGGESTQQAVNKRKEESDATDDDAAGDGKSDSDSDNEEESGVEVEKAEYASHENEILKAIETSDERNLQMFRAVGVLVKDCRQALSKADARHEADQELIKGMSEEISEMSGRLEQFGSVVPAQKSVTSARAVERGFEKSNTADDLSGEGNKTVGLASNQVRIGNREAITEILDRASFAKGYDAEFSKACTGFEASGNLPAGIIARLKNEHGIEIVK